VEKILLIKSKRKKKDQEGLKVPNLPKLNKQPKGELKRRI
jgi:hypothetical protein